MIEKFNFGAGLQAKSRTSMEHPLNRHITTKEPTEGFCNCRRKCWPGFIFIKYVTRQLSSRAIEKSSYLKNFYSSLRHYCSYCYPVPYVVRYFELISSPLPLPPSRVNIYCLRQNVKLQNSYNSFSFFIFDAYN